MIGDSLVFAPYHDLLPSLPYSLLSLLATYHVILYFITQPNSHDTPRLCDRQHPFDHGSTCTLMPASQPNSWPGLGSMIPGPPEGWLDHDRKSADCIASCLRDPFIGGFAGRPVALPSALPASSPHHLSHWEKRETRNEKQETRNDVAIDSNFHPNDCQNPLKLPRHFSPLPINSLISYQRGPVRQLWALN